ncbi:hypothetical protein [Burkholderia sp. WSM2232]|uniref:hypothetical protein n=1 Tax=Burkholderia sp. WSM2232 TaxID=944436 RepID=UPI0003F6E88F|nr:hypothetical protein [Burkholderia sp. WSM2232]
MPIFPNYAVTTKPRESAADVAPIIPDFPFHPEKTRVKGEKKPAGGRFDKPFPVGVAGQVED